MKHTSKARYRAAVSLSIVGILTMAACGSAESSTDEDTLSIVGFAVPEAANKAIAEKFVQTEAGDGITFRSSYGASGTTSSSATVVPWAEPVPSVSTSWSANRRRGRPRRRAAS